MLRATADTHPGRERENNEDRVHCDNDRGIFIVVDGVGGQAAGEKAADVALSLIRTRLERKTGTAVDRIREAITVANNEIYHLSQTRPEWEGMACVLTAAVIEDGQASIGHVGDTRLYKVRDGKIEKITHDHSPVGEREDSGQLSEREAMRHPRRNEIYRDVGSSPKQPDDEDFIEILETPVEPDSALVMCSDGLTDLVTSAEILETVQCRAGDPERSVRELIHLANRAGGKDNVSTIVIEGEGFGSSRSGGHGFVRALTSRWATFLYGVVVTLLGVAVLRPYLNIRPNSPANSPPPIQVQQRVPLRLLVSLQGPEFVTIGQALQKAQAGDVIEVAPGEYVEQIRMKEGVTILSQRPFEALIRLSDHMPPDKIGVAAHQVKSGRLSGFKIISEKRNPLTVGVSIIDSSVRFDSLEILGATEAAIVVAGKSAAFLSTNYVHDNIGTGVLITEEAVPRLVNNWIVENGKISRPRRRGVEIVGQAAPRVERNIIANNGIEGIQTNALVSEKLLLKENFFSLGRRR